MNVSECINFRFDNSTTCVMTAFVNCVGTATEFTALQLPFQTLRSGCGVIVSCRSQIKIG